MLEEYFSYSAELLPEGRRAFALTLATNISHDHMSAAQIVESAALFEAWLHEAEAKAATKPRAVK